MTTLQTIYHKKNEIQEVEFFKDKECTEAFDFTNAKNLYIDGLNGDITPIYILKDKYYWRNVYTPYMPHKFSCEPCDNIVTLNDININLSKYIPEDSAVLFLSEEDCNKYAQRKCHYFNGYYLQFSEKDSQEAELFLLQKEELQAEHYFRRNSMTYQEGLDFYKKISETINIKTSGLTIFLPHGTHSEIQKAKEVEKELKEKYGVEEVNLFVLHCFLKECDIEKYDTFYTKMYIVPKNPLVPNTLEHPMWRRIYDFNKIITTNSTGILKPEYSTERLQVIDAKEIFEEYLKLEQAKL